MKPIPWEALADTATVTENLEWTLRDRRHKVIGRMHNDIYRRVICWHLELIANWRDAMTPRKLTDHLAPTDAINAGIDIFVHDEPGPGGANHFYVIDPHNGPRCTIHFQNGTVAEHGVNGITQEALLAVVLDRLRSFQAGPYSCRENAIALTKIDEALMWLHLRTAKRVQRGVEGKMEK